MRIIKLMLVSSLEEVGGVRRSARTWEAIVALYYAALQHPTIRIYDYIGDAGPHNGTPGELGWVPLQLTPITQGGART